MPLNFPQCRFDDESNGLVEVHAAWPIRRRGECIGSSAGELKRHGTVNELWAYVALESEIDFDVPSADTGLHSRAHGLTAHVPASEQTAVLPRHGATRHCTCWPPHTGFGSFWFKGMHLHEAVEQ